MYWYAFSSTPFTCCVALLWPLLVVTWCDLFSAIRFCINSACFLSRALLLFTVLRSLVRSRSRLLRTVPRFPAYRCCIMNQARDAGPNRFQRFFRGYGGALLVFSYIITNFIDKIRHIFPLGRIFRQEFGSVTITLNS